MSTPYPGQQPPYPGQPPFAGQPPHGGPPPGWGAPPPPPGPPAPPPRSGPPLGLVLGCVAVVVVVGLVTTVLVVRALGGDDGGSDGFGAGPGSEPEEAWSADLDEGDDVTVLSDGDRVYAVVSAEDEDFDTSAVVTAYAADDGEELWSESLASSGFDEPLRLLGDDQVLLVDADDDDTTTSLVDATTGEEVWQADGEPSDAQASVGIGPILDPGPLDPLYFTVSDDDSDEETVVAVDRASGDEVWDAEGGEALPCGGDAVITYVDGETDEESFTPAPGEVVVRDIETGDELWSQDAYPGFCSDGRVALGTDADEVTVFDVASGDERATIGLDGVDDGLVYAIPFGDFVAVSQISFEEEGAAYAAIFPIDGGEPTWEGDDTFVFPVGDDVALAGDQGGSDATLVRARDGEDLGRVSVSTDDNDCDGALSPRTVLVCASDSPDVTSYSLEDGLDEVWTVDVGFDVAAIAVGGDTLFAVGDDELVALR